MTAGAPQPAPLTIAADGSYAARLVAQAAPGGDGGSEAEGEGGGWCPERWTLDSPEPYAVRLPGERPEEPGSQVLPLADGRVLIARRGEGRYHFALLYPSGPDTGELPLGAVECERLTLLPPAPGGARAYALVPREGGGEPGTALWLVCGGTFGPELVSQVAGRCSGGAWLDAQGRLLALDRTDAAGHTRTVTVDVERGGEPTELLRIAEESNDRLLLADPDSGLLLVRSDAPGTDRIGWGVLGSHRPVRFPEALHPAEDGVGIEPFAIQPGQMLMPESCGVALRMTAAAGAEWVAVWRPQQRELQHLAAPEGWLPGTGLWTAGGELLLPYAGPEVPCGLARIAVPVPEPRERQEQRELREQGEPNEPNEPATAAPQARTTLPEQRPEPVADTARAEPAQVPEPRQPGDGAEPPPAAAAEPASAPEPGPVAEAAPEAEAPEPEAPEAEANQPPAEVAKPVPLQQAPLSRVS